MIFPGVGVSVDVGIGLGDGLNIFPFGRSIFQVSIASFRRRGLYPSARGRGLSLDWLAGWAG